METAGNTRDAVGGLDAGNGAIRPPGCHKSGVTGGFLGVGGQAWAPGAGLQAGACTQQVTRKHRVLSATRPLTPRHQTSTVETGSLWSVKGPRPCPAPTRFPPLRPRPPSPRPRPLPTPILRAGRLDRCRLPVPPTRICSPGPESSRPARPLLLHHQPLGCCDSYQPWRAGRGRSQEPGSSTGRDGVSPGPRGRGGLISGPRPAPRMGDERRSPLLPQHRLCLSAGRGRAQPAPRPHPDTRPLGLVAMETVPGGRPAGPNNLTPGWGATSPVGGVRLRVHLRGGGGSVDALGAAAFRCSAVHPQRPHEWRNLPKVTALSSRLRVPRARALGLCPRVAESPTDCSGPARDAVLSDPSVSSTR